MNKELIKKYKAEFEHWLNGGKLICLIDNPNENWFQVLPNSQVFESSYTFPIKHIVINDEYVEFRKALAEGKTVQVNNLFNDAWTDIITPKFTCRVEYYRIKPEEPQFKVGDFVRNTSSDIIFKYDDTMLAPDSSCCIKWKPQAGELCWFGSSGISNHAVLSITKDLTQFGTLTPFDQ